MNHEQKVREWLSPLRRGVEIGAFKTPIQGINPYYVDCFEEYAGEACLLDFKGDACHLPFLDNSLDYIASSHVLEHVANPILAFYEWARVLRPNGIIYMVIPDKRFTWDRHRDTVVVDHLISDYINKIDQRDGTHVDDFIDGIVWSEYAPGKDDSEKGAYRDILSASTKAGLEINIHFHAYEPQLFPEVIRGVNDSKLLPHRFDLIDIVEKFPEETPNGFLVVLRVKKRGFGNHLNYAYNTAKNYLFSDNLVTPGTKRLQR